jgi:Calpain family cysteine protease
MSSNETWVPLIEKAYAKFYGNYSYLSFGLTMHAMEDLTGGVCRRMRLTDIVDKDRLWHEISRGIDHNTLYGCGSIQSPTHKTIHNLGSRHAYGILRTGEYKGKRFLVVRNPWGNDKEWNGRWSDNAKEWTDEWQPALAILNHSFGADGQFVMECK